MLHVTNISDLLTGPYYYLKTSLQNVIYFRLSVNMSSFSDNVGAEGTLIKEGTYFIYIHLP